MQPKDDSNRAQIRLDQLAMIQLNKAFQHLTKMLHKYRQQD